MHRKFPLLVLLAVCCMWPLTEARAGAWSQQKGHYYAKLSAILYDADEAFDGDGNRGHADSLDATFESNHGFLYIEYGLLERLTLLTQVSAGRLISENPEVRLTTTAVGDWDIGAKYQILQWPVVLSPYVSFKVPTGYDENNNPAIGTGDLDMELRLLVARSLHPVPLYLGAELGFRFRGGPFSKQVPYFFEVGATPHEKVFVKVYLEGKDTLLAGGGNADAMHSMSMQISEGDFTKVGVNTAVKVYGNTSVDLVYDVIFVGKNVGAGSAFGIGLSYSY